MKQVWQWFLIGVGIGAGVLGIYLIYIAGFVDGYTQKVKHVQEMIK